MTSVEERRGVLLGTGPDTRTRFAVAWQNQISRSIYPVGVLDLDRGTYRFAYLRSVVHVPSFVPFVGFPDLSRVYTSTRLFPFFAQRVMDRRRPDFPEYAAALGLTEDATELDLLARSSGNRIGDSVRLSLEPVVGGDGRIQYDFPVHGLRHVSDRQAAEAQLRSLRPDDPLRLQAEPTNLVNSNALLITTTSGVVLGWVPDLLLDFVHQAKNWAEVRVTAFKVNTRDQPPHLGLFARLAGSGPPGYRAFSGHDWSTFADADGPR